MYISSLPAGRFVSLKNVVLLVDLITVFAIRHTDIIYNTTQLYSIAYHDFLIYWRSTLAGLQLYDTSSLFISYKQITKPITPDDSFRLNNLRR